MCPWCEADISQVVRDVFRKATVDNVRIEASFDCPKCTRPVIGTLTFHATLRKDAAGEPNVR